MKAKKPMVSKAENERRILVTLAKSVNPKTEERVPLNAAQLQDKADIKGRQTVLNLISQLQRSGWLSHSVGQWRKGRYTVYYMLSDSGLRAARAIYPELGAKSNQEHAPTIEQRREMNLRALDYMLDLFRQAIKRGQSPACNYEWTLVMSSDSQGKLSWRYKATEKKDSEKK